jgi:hypothetical protein
MNAELIADMSAAPEIAILADATLFVPAQPPARRQHGQRGEPIAHGEPGAHVGNGRPGGQPSAPPTLGTLARQLRLLAASPERWWGLVRFDPDRSVRIEIEDQPEYGAWLMILPPGDAGQDCDCHVATVIAGEATEGAPGSAVLRPGPTRVHGRRHRLRGHGAGYSISLHARAIPSAPANTRSPFSKS